MKLTIQKAKEIMEKNHGGLDLSNTSITSLPENLTVRGDLDLSYTPITSLPENLTVGNSLFLSNTKITSLPKSLTVGGWLNLSSTPITSLPENLTVEGCLLLSNTCITSLPEKLTVRGWLDLSNTPIASLPENLTVGDGLSLSNTQITSLPESLTIGGSLNLSHTLITSLPENLIVVDDLDLSHTPITSLPKNLIVGGSLNLSHTLITSLPENLTIGKTLYVKCSKTSKNKKKVKHLKQGDYKKGKYLFADGILTLVKNEKHFNEYTFFVGRISNRNIIFDGENYAHCKTLREGISDLLFKKTKNRNLEQYKNFSLDMQFTVSELVTMYRVITGACKQGSESFVANIKDLKEKYSIREAIQLTKGQYNAEAFEKFFE